MVDPELMVKQESLRARHVQHGRGKSLNENLAPLRRFLHSQLGELWDRVFSEICANITVTNTVQKHVRDHVSEMVCVHVWRDSDGVLWDHCNTPTLLSRSRFRYWVDPTDGALRLNTLPTARQRRLQREAHQRAAKHEVSRSLPNSVELRKAHGIWYEVDVEPVPPMSEEMIQDDNGELVVHRMGGVAHDVILGHSVSNCRPSQYPYAQHYCCRKRQLNHNELEKWKLKNG
jgi:hypothetical protein